VYKYCPIRIEFSYLLFLDEKKQKSFDRTELAKNPKLTLKCFNSSHTPKTFFNALTADFLYANSVMSEAISPSTAHYVCAQDERDLL
jgi:hypothetical protein